MSFWVGSSFNDLLYPMPTFNLREGLNVMLHNPEVLDAGQLWQSDYGETQTLDVWRDGYVLTVNPDGTYRAIMKFGTSLPPLTLTRVPTMAAETFEAHGDSTIKIPPWPEGAVIRSETYQDEFGNTKTRNPVQRGSGVSQEWENPNDWTLITGVCSDMTQTPSCTPPPTAQWATEAGNNDMRFYVDSGEPQAAYMKCNGCDGTWTETKEIVDMEKVWHWAWAATPRTLPTGWRIDKNGHLTNLPVELEVTSRLDALEKGVSVIYGVDWKRHYTVYHPCVYHTNPEYNQLSERECSNIGWIGGETETEYLDWAISEAKDFANREGIKTYWWLETPTFTASCADKTDSNYNDEVNYWDPTRCADYDPENGESTGNIPWVPIIAAGSVIAALTWGATVYGGSMTWGQS